jgi:hypothetical protein
MKWDCIRLILTSALIPFDEIIESQFSLQSKIPQGNFLL